ncbi:MAG: hypothetical protein J6X92_06525 [Bacteroidales bacterium]|nr:hypothetical protein [Bacteroidales bacterium]
MKKTILYVSGVFIVAFLLGMLTSAQIRNKKLEPVRTFFSEGEYVRNIARIVQPTKEQWEEFDTIIKKYGAQNAELQKTFRDEIQTNMDAFRKEIDKLLTKEQREKLKKVEEERKKMFEEFMKGRNDSIPPDRNRYDRNRYEREKYERERAREKDFENRVKNE